MSNPRRAARIIPMVSNQHLLLVTLLVCNAACMETLPIFLDKLLSPVFAIVISVTLILFFGEVRQPQRSFSRILLLSLLLFLRGCEATRNCIDPGVWQRRDRPTAAAAWLNPYVSASWIHALSSFAAGATGHNRSPALARSLQARDAVVSLSSDWDKKNPQGPFLSAHKGALLWCLKPLERKESAGGQIAPRRGSLDKKQPRCEQRQGSISIRLLVGTLCSSILGDLQLLNNASFACTCRSFLRQSALATGWPSVRASRGLCGASWGCASSLRGPLAR